MKKQLNLSLFRDELSEVKTNKKEFLERMEKLIPWTKWVGIIAPFYYSGKRGNKPYDLELMLRIHVLQMCYNLSDMGAHYEIIDSRAFSKFCCVESSNQIPDGDTIGRFRNILIQNGLQEKIFADVVEQLKANGLLLIKGTIVDSTLVSAPSSTKNAERARDPEACQTKKGNQWHFGYKSHIGVDSDSGLVHHVEVTAANIHDISMVQDLLEGTETDVYGDSGYLGAEKRMNAVTTNEDGQEIEYRICRRPSQLKKLEGAEYEEQRKIEHEKSSIRCKVEHVFGIVKRQFGFRKTRLKGRRRLAGQMNMALALANLILADRLFRSV